VSDPAGGGTFGAGVPVGTGTPQLLPHARAAEAVDALCDAFHDYPVMRYVIGDAGEDYGRRLDLLIGLFVANRVLRGNPILTIADGGWIVGVATVTPPVPGEAPPEFEERRAALWAELGEDARARHAHLMEVWETVPVTRTHYHLNMLGVRRSHAGRGLGGRLLRAVHDMSRRDPASEGVSLSTEDPKNVPLYLGFGYEVTFHARVDDALETWTFFRPEKRGAE
jgi:GNAT superfamily N-acetyltransferase